MIDATELRAQVRVILATRLADETIAEAYILAALDKFFGKGRVKAQDMMRALQWNEARGWAATRWNADYERDEWKLSDRGRVKEGL